MQFFLSLVRAFREYLVFLALCIVSIVAIAQNNSPAIQVLRAASLAVIGTLQSATGWFGSAFGPGVENEALRSVNISLMEEVMELRRSRHENNELRRMLGFRERSVYTLLPAEVVGRNNTLGSLTITLNVGESDSVRPGMPIINETGVVGKITAVSAGYSIAQLALNRNFRVSAKTVRSRVDGIIYWEEGDRLLLQNIWKTADIVEGDTVVTSAYSNVFPDDIPIGGIEKIGPGKTGQFSYVVVKPYTNFFSLDRVFVIRYRPQPEKQALEERVTPAKPEP